MTVDMIPITSRASLFNAASSVGAGTDGAIRARRDFSRLGRHSDPAVLGYQREPMTVVSEFYTADNTDPFVTTGAQA